MPQGPPAASPGAPQVATRSELFRLLVQSVRDYAIILLDPAGRIISWNEGAQRIKGYAAAEVLGREFSIFYPASDVAAGKPARKLQEAALEGRVEDEGWRVRKDGSRFWANVVITAIRDDEGRPVGFGKVTRDLTARRHSDEERLDIERQAAISARKHADGMSDLERAKTQLLNLASHELRGPLTVISGYLSLIEDTPLEEKLDVVLRCEHVLVSKARQMQLLVDEMLEAAMLEDSRLELTRRRFDLVALVRQVVAEQTAALVEGRHQLTVAPHPPVIVDGDQRRVATILANLVGNAVKYSPNGGRVTCVPGVDGDDARLEVRDEGVGIREKDLGILFSRFGRLRDPATAHVSGTGLGLFLCRELARLHGGDIEVSSRHGAGATFTLRLPLAAVEAAGHTQPKASRPR